MEQHIESKQSNLWHVANRDHLLSYLMDCKKKFVVLAIVMIDSPDQIKVMIRKHIKDKSKMYQNVTFLYFPIKKEDFGKIWDLLPNDESSYPRIYHLYDVDKMLGEAWNLKDKSKLSDSELLFNKFHNYYVNGIPNNEQKTNSPKQAKIQKDNTISDGEGDESNNNDETETKPYDISGNEVKTQTSNQIAQQDINKPNFALEKKKLIEKINFIKQNAEDFKTSFCKEIKKRKEKMLKIEEKRKAENNDSSATKHKKKK